MEQKILICLMCKLLEISPRRRYLKKIVMVRLDSIILLDGKEDQSPPGNAPYTIKYLYEAGARVTIVGSWSESANSRLPSGAYPSTEFVAGGGNLADKAVALQILASTCDGLVFVGSLAFQIMHALGVPVRMEFVELGASKDAQYCGVCKVKKYSTCFSKCRLVYQ